METLAALQASLEGGLAGIPCAAFHGGLPAGAREAEGLRFQRGEARVVLFTVEEGISLHQGKLAGQDTPRSEVIHDRPRSGVFV